MSELTITLLRLGYLVLLWVFVLFADRRAAPRPVRHADHRPSPSQGRGRCGGRAVAHRAAGPRRRRPASRAARSGSRPDPARRDRGPAARHDAPARHVGGPHRPRAELHARAGRRLLVVAARPDLPAGRPVVRRGPRLDERHIRRRTSASTAPTPVPPGTPGPRGPERPRAAEVDPVTIALRYAARSDVGLVRSNNQDSAYAGPHLLHRRRRHGRARGRRRRVVGRGRRVRAAGRRGARSRRRAGRSSETALGRRPRRDHRRAATPTPSSRGMGTTVTAHPARRQQARDGAPGRLARLPAARRRRSRRSPPTTRSCSTWSTPAGSRAEEAEHHPQRSVVMRVLGDFDPEVDPDLSVREARPGDRWLLCSDGLSRLRERARPSRRRMATIADVDACADRLVQLALRAGGGGQHHRRRSRTSSSSTTSPTARARRRTRTVVGAAAPDAATTPTVRGRTARPARAPPGLASAGAAAGGGRRTRREPAGAAEAGRRTRTSEPPTPAARPLADRSSRWAGRSPLRRRRRRRWSSLPLDADAVLRGGRRRARSPSSAASRRRSGPIALSSRRRAHRHVASTTSTRATCGSASSRPSTPTPSTTPATWSRCSRRTPRRRRRPTPTATPTRHALRPAPGRPTP